MSLPKMCKRSSKYYFKLGKPVGIDYYGRHATAESELVKRTLATIKKLIKKKKL